MALESRIRKLEISGGSRLNAHDRRVLQREQLRRQGLYIEQTPEEKQAASESLRAKMYERDKARGFKR